MPKIINLKSPEDITAVIERLWETGAAEVYFTVPKGAGFLKNVVALKLLKREADRLEKTVVLVTKDEVGREMAKRAGLAVRVAMPKSAAKDDDVQEEESASDDSNQDVLTEVSSNRYESLLEEEIKLKRERGGHLAKMDDIKPAAKRVHSLKVHAPDESDEENGDSHQKIELKLNIESESESKRNEDDNLDALLKSVDEPESDGGVLWNPAHWKKDFAERLFRDKDQAISKKEKHSLLPLFSTKFLAIFFGAAIIIAAGVLYFVLPKAEVAIVPKTESYVQDLAITAEKSASKIDEAQLKIPAQLIKLDKKESKDLPATGQRQLNEKARGVITIFNEYSSSPQGLVEKTRFVSDNGKTFRLTKSITVPGAKIEEGKIISSSIDAEVAADQPGEDYNIGPSDFKIPGFEGTPKYTAFYGRSKNPMVGGAIGMAKVVSQEDFDKAKAELWAKLQSEIEQEVKAQVPEGLKLLDKASKIEMTGVESSVPVGNRADIFTLTVKGSGSILFFDEKDISELASKKAAPDDSGGKNLDEDQRQIAYRDVKADFSRGQLNLKAQVTDKLIWDVGADELKRLIAGKNEAQIKQIFSQRSEIEKARILFWPFWVKSVPENLDKIEIKISSE